MNIQPLQFDDIDSVRELQPPDWGDIVPMHEYYLKTSFCYPIKIVIDNTIVGIGTSVLHPDIAWLAHIIVDQNFRNKGIGRTITQALIDFVKTTNLETIKLLATDLGEPVYKKLGFKTEGEYSFFKDGKIEQEILVNIFPFDEKYKEKILHLDREVSGEDRAMRLGEHLQQSFVYVLNDEIEGYYLPTFGEGLIIATNDKAGIPLMKFRLAKNAVTVLPDENKSAVEFLIQNNFIAYRKAKRMWLGKERAWQPGMIYNRVSGQIG